MPSSVGAQGFDPRVLLRSHGKRLLGAVQDVLHPGGRFTTFAYVQGLLLPPARRFEKLLRAQFPQVRRTRVVWRNLPPAFAYVATKTAADA